MPVQTRNSGTMVCVPLNLSYLRFDIIVLTIDRVRRWLGTDESLDWVSIAIAQWVCLTFILSNRIPTKRFGKHKFFSSSDGRKRKDKGKAENANKHSGALSGNWQRDRYAGVTLLKFSFEWVADMFISSSSEQYSLHCMPTRILQPFVAGGIWRTMSTIFCH